MKTGQIARFSFWSICFLDSSTIYPQDVADKTTPALPSTSSSWRDALVWGFGIAFVHRLVLILWLPIVWLLLGPYFGGASADFHTATASIPALTTPFEQTFFGVWRRWDAVHYFDLATNGYQVEHPGPTVFGPLTPLLIGATARVLPIDVASMVVMTLAFGVALTFLFRFCATYFHDEQLGKWSVLVTALLPLSYFFAAPMSESIFLLCATACVYAASQQKWWWVGIAGGVAVLARSQGILLFGVALLFQLPVFVYDYANKYWRKLLFLPASLLIIVAAFFGFNIYRQGVGLPSLSETYTRYSFNYFTNPIDGLLTNFRWIVTHPDQLLNQLDLLAMPIAFGLALVTILSRRHRRLPLLAYTWASLLLFVSRINYAYGTDIVMYTQSFGRYTLVLFPLTILIADGLLRVSPRLRQVAVVLMACVLLYCSALYVVAISGP